VVATPISACGCSESADTCRSSSSRPSPGSPTFTYQWLRNGITIVGATASTFRVTSADAGTALSCVVTGTNSAGSVQLTLAPVHVPATTTTITTPLPPVVTTPTQTTPPTAVEPSARCQKRGQRPFVMRLGVPFRGMKRADVVNGTRGADRIAGALGNDRLCGGSGVDVIAGGPGNDFMSGGPGSDKLTGGTGRDVVLGGAGNDTINVREKAAGDTVSCGAGRDKVIADRRDKVARDCERVIRR